MKNSKIILFGGNGFVGTQIAKELVTRNVETVCVSRTGAMPTHLKSVDWAQQVDWMQGDALNPDPELFTDATVVVSLIGSPPVPTFSKEAYAKQLAMNSEPNLSVIAAAGEFAVPRLVLLGAHLPSMIQTDKFAYAKGKRLCEEAAHAFVQESGQASAVILKPTAIYGTRYTPEGKAINIAAVMQPLAKLQNLIPTSVRSYLPETFVNVNAVANAAAGACLDHDFADKLTVLTNQEIIDYQ